MADDDLPRSEKEDPKREFRDLVMGLAISTALTIAAFAAAIIKPFSHFWLLGSLGGLALLQIAIQFRFFMHVDVKKSHRDDLQLVLFTSLVILLMLGGSIWILFNQHARMG